MLKVTHDQFVSVVREGRGDRLKEFPDMFSGLIWSGEQALEYGLIDGLASAGSLARDIIKEENIVDYTFELSPVEKALRQLGASMGQSIVRNVAQSSLPTLH